MAKMNDLAIAAGTDVVAVPDPRARLKLIGAAALVTALAAGAGSLYGVAIISTVKDAIDAKARMEEAATAPRYTDATNLKELPPIITNLADPPDTWIRLEAAIVFDSKPDPVPAVMAGEITGDILAFLRTLTLSQIEGASGLRQLREDLNERVAIRSSGRVHELIIQTLVVQ
ncbi:flagellar FliL protein [Rhizobiales bacterium GAS191]|nr:flagellar FliL protein [Rhizobiales bacterium GAS113]SED39591.1 flagellar FliL protein [Rhizobiales bacterium GAS188]SEE94715.1 flagellar FliL protein [Rhizobiales bacterium GAS191]